MSSQTEKLFGYTCIELQTHHHLSEAKTARQEQNIFKSKSVLQSAHPFGFPDEGTRLFNVITKEIIPEKIQNGILEIQNNGEEGLKVFVKERICGTKNLWDKMTKIKN